MDLIWKFAKILWGQNFFLHLWGDKPLWGELKLHGGSNMLLHFHYLIYLETANTQKSKVFLLLISSGNVRASGVASCQYPQIY